MLSIRGNRLISRHNFSYVETTHLCLPNNKHHGPRRTTHDKEKMISRVRGYGRSVMQTPCSEYMHNGRYRSPFLFQKLLLNYAFLNKILNMHNKLREI